MDTCQECAKKKGHKLESNEELNSIIAKEAFDILGMDFFELLPTTKNENTLILSFTDHYSKWVELFIVKRDISEIHHNKIWSYETINIRL